MFSYLVKRFSLAVLTLLIIMMVSYLLIRLAPGDPTKSSMLGENPGASQGLSSERSELAENISLRKKLYLDKPVMVGFFYWLKGVIMEGDFGTSASVDKGRPVAALIMERLPVTLSLNICAILIIYLIAIPLGIYSAISQRKKLDKGLTFGLFILYSLPSFWIALLLQATFCEGGRFPIFPIKGITANNTWGVSTWEIMGQTAMHYVLPVFCLCYGGLAGLSRYAKAGMLEVIKKDYIRTARAKGVPEYLVVLKHALRNAMIILITLFAGLLPGLVAGSIIIENIFTIPGMGSLSLTALTSRDHPLLMALFAFGGSLTLAGILLSDLLYVLVDPRISFESRKN
jgi:peptide/nickel transport system permease protein